MVCFEGKVFCSSFDHEHQLEMSCQVPHHPVGTAKIPVLSRDTGNATVTAHTAPSLSHTVASTAPSASQGCSLCSPGGIFWLLFALDPSFPHSHLPSCFYAPCSGSLTPPQFYLGTLLLFLQHVLGEAVCVHPHSCPLFLPPSLHSAPVRLTLISPLFLSITHSLLSHTQDLIWF